MISNRREVLRYFSGLAGGALLGRSAWGENRPAATQPRATAGDTVAEPKWNESLGITVGVKQGDLIGDSDKAIQAAVDYVARIGGGTVRILPGTYRLRNSVFLRSGVRLFGSGEDSILVKEPMIEAKLAADSDAFDQEITFADAGGLRVGDGVCIRAGSPFHSGSILVKRTLVARDGNRFKLDRPLREDVWLSKSPTISTLFPLLTAENASDLVVENVTLDGNKADNGNLNGNYAGCIWFQDCIRVRIEGVIARNYNGDGISFQTCHDTIVSGCRAVDNVDLGIHPGTGSQRPVIRGNRMERNRIGLYVCWGVHYGLFEKNVMADNRDFGISIGHRDNNNVIRNNDVLRSGTIGVLFRPENGKGYTARDNVLEGNRIVDSGPENGIGIDVRGFTESNTIARNRIIETRGPAKRIGVRLAKESGDIRLIDNTIEGFATPVSDLRGKG